VIMPGRGSDSELVGLQTTRQAVDAARQAWQGPGPSRGFDPPAGWVTLFPGVYLEPARIAAQEPTLVLANPDGTQRRQPVSPPARLTDEDRFLFRLLQRRLTEGKDQSLSAPVARWIEAHGAALGVQPAPRS
jgi:hypothetical protein